MTSPGAQRRWIGRYSPGLAADTVFPFTATCACSAHPGIRRWNVNSAALAGVMPTFTPPQAAEIHHAPVGLQQIVHGGNAFRNVGLAAAPPEPGLDGHRAHGDIPQLRVARFGEVLDALLFPARAIDQRRHLSLSGLLHTWSRSPALCKQFSPG